MSASIQLGAQLGYSAKVSIACERRYSYATLSHHRGNPSVDERLLQAPEKAWKVASEENTEQAYEEFLLSTLNSEFGPTARERLDDLRWKTTAEYVLLGPTRTSLNLTR